MKRDNDLWEKWAIALESGKYKQTDGLMKRVNEDTNSVSGYCCLGVAREHLKLDDGVDFSGYLGKRTELVDEERNKIGISLTEMEFFIGLNDALNFDFNTIGALIEFMRNRKYTITKHEDNEMPSL